MEQMLYEHCSDLLINFTNEYFHIFVKDGSGEYNDFPVVMNDYSMTPCMHLARGAPFFHLSQVVYFM